ncbi:copper resistance CopC family protein [Georgenia daeguensis]|uniref:CopC domain-containing protein n=1 Tax=Georgenia daeguensis TaxID=908355 RepID=A0ABP8EP73_9MICO
MSTSAARRALLLPLLTILLAVAVLAAPARAHDALTGSQPADGAQLEAAPDELVLTFNNGLLDSAQAVVVTDAAGATVAEGSPAIDGTTATLDLPDLAGGQYAVTWSVVSSDGHRIGGELSFSVAQPAPVTTSEPPAAPSQPAATASPDQLTTPDDATAPDATATADADEGVGGIPSGVPAWLVILMAVAVAGAVVALAVRRWRDQG